MESMGKVYLEALRLAVFFLDLSVQRTPGGCKGRRGGEGERRGKETGGEERKGERRCGEVERRRLGKR